MRFVLDKKKKLVTLFFYKAISNYTTPPEEVAANILQWQLAGYKTLCVRINSIGGSVIAGNAIANAIQQSTMKTIACTDGIAASMSSAIQKSFDEVHIAANGKIMIHNIRGFASGEVKDIERELKLMKDMQSDLVGYYVNRTKLTEAKIIEMMDAETWLNAKEALRLGFVDEIYDAVVTIEEPEEMNDGTIKNIYKNFTDKLVAQLDITNPQNQNSKIMENTELIAMLGLPANSTDAQVKAALKAQKEKADRVDDLEAQVNATRETEIKALLDKAKVPAEKREHYVAIAKVDFDSFKSIIGDFQPKAAVKPMSIVSQSSNKSDEDIDPSEFKNWEELAAKGNDFVESFKAEHQEKYIALYTKEFGFEPTIRG